jgi:hypothetical protein
MRRTRQTVALVLVGCVSSAGIATAQIDAGQRVSFSAQASDVRLTFPNTVEQTWRVFSADLAPAPAARSAGRLARDSAAAPSDMAEGPLARSVREAARQASVHLDRRAVSNARGQYGSGHAVQGDEAVAWLITSALCAGLALLLASR